MTTEFLEKALEFIKFNEYAVVYLKSGLSQKVFFGVTKRILKLLIPPEEQDRKILGTK